MQCASVRERVQMSSCARTCAFVRCTPTKALCNVRVQMSSCMYGVLVRNQYGSCTGACAAVRCAPTIFFFQGASADGTRAETRF